MIYSNIWEELIRIGIFRYVTRNRNLNLRTFTMHDIKTLVYFDLEATGLRNSGRPRITELSLVAVNLHDVLGIKRNLKIVF